MSPAPVGIAPKPAPVPAASPAAPASAPAPAPTAGSPAPTSGAGSAPAGPPTDAAAAAKALVGDIRGLVTTTKNLDAAWATSALTAKSALESMPKDGKLDPASASAMERIIFTGRVLGIEVPKDAKPATLDAKTPPAAAILAAEQAFSGAVRELAKQGTEVFGRVPKGVPKEVEQVLGAVRGRITDALYALKFSETWAPAPKAEKPAEPAGGSATGSGSAPAPSGSTPSPAPPAGSTSAPTPEPTTKVPTPDATAPAPAPAPATTPAPAPAAKPAPTAPAGPVSAGSIIGAKE